MFETKIKYSNGSLPLDKVNRCKDSVCPLQPRQVALLPDSLSRRPTPTADPSARMVHLPSKPRLWRAPTHRLRDSDSQPPLSTVPNLRPSALQSRHPSTPVEQQRRSRRCLRLLASYLLARSQFPLLLALLSPLHKTSHLRRLLSPPTRSPIRRSSILPRPIDRIFETPLSHLSTRTNIVVLPHLPHPSPSLPLVKTSALPSCIKRVSASWAISMEEVFPCGRFDQKTSMRRMERTWTTRRKSCWRRRTRCRRGRSKAPGIKRANR